MICAADSSVFVEAMAVGLPHHESCHRLVEESALHAHVHTLSETFSTLTGGRLGARIPAMIAADLIRSDLVPLVTFHTLTAEEILRAFDEAESRGIRGGAIHDYLHLAAARKIGALRIYTLNMSDFRSFHRPGDPEIVHP